MSYMKRFLEDVADELGVPVMDQRALDEANYRLGQPDPLDEWVLTPAEAAAIDAALQRLPSTIAVQKLRIQPRLCPTRGGER